MTERLTLSLSTFRRQKKSKYLLFVLSEIKTVSLRSVETIPWSSWSEFLLLLHKMPSVVTRATPVLHSKLAPPNF